MEKDRFGSVVECNIVSVAVGRKERPHDKLDSWEETELSENQITKWNMALTSPQWALD